jgi:hypothetical protein
MNKTDLAKSFSTFEEDLVYVYDCSVTEFCKHKGITLHQYFTYLEDNTHLQTVHNKASEIRSRVEDYLIELKHKNAILNDDFLAFDIFNFEHSVSRIEKGPSITKIKYLKDLIGKSDTVGSTNIEININSNDL